MKNKFNVTGMTCSACSSRVEKCVSSLDGIKKVEVNLLTNTMQAEYDEEKLSDGEIIAAVKKAGYGASVFEKKAASKQKTQEKQDTMLNIFLMHFQEQRFGISN